uniref:Sodium-dependent glucose transporter 1 n=1 Tax=Strigamia maritima TaxID=126957 RepID=T1J1J3_STRMM
MPAEFLREEEDFEEDTLFDQAGLLTNKIKQKSDVRSSSTAMRITPMKTFALCLAFFGLGLTTAILEPTLLDLQHLAGTDVQHISFTISARSAGLILGSILGGNVLCLDLWGRQSGPFLQAIHFSLALGLFISPFLCNAILAGKAGISASDSPRALNINNSYALALPASTLFSVQVIPLAKHSRRTREVNETEFDSNNETTANNSAEANSTTSEISLNETCTSTLTATLQPNVTNDSVTTAGNATHAETNATTKSHKPKPPIIDGGRLPVKKDPTWKQVLTDVDVSARNASDSNELMETNDDVIEDSSEESNNSTTHRKPATFNNQTDDNQQLLSDLLNKISELGVTKVHIVYAAMSVIVLLTSVVFLSFLCHNPRELRSKQGDIRDIRDTHDRGQQGKFASVMTAIFFIFMMFYTGAELIFGQLYLSLVLQSSVHLLRTRGSLLISVFWGVYTFSRGTSICCTNGFKPATMLLVDLSCCIVSAITLVVFGPQVESILWCSVAVMAIGLSSILPYSLLWLEDYIHISNKTACTIFLGNSIVHFVLSFLYGHPISLSSTVVIYLVLACCVFALLIFGVAWRLATWRGDKYKYAKTNVKYQLANQMDDDDENVEMASSSSSLYLLNNESSHNNSDHLYLPLKQKEIFGNERNYYYYSL